MPSLPRLRPSALPVAALLTVAVAGPIAAQSDINVPAGGSTVINESGSYQNVTVGSGATLQTVSGNSGGAGNHAISVTFAASGPGTIQDNGFIDVASTDQNNTLIIANSVTLSGGGTLQLRNGYVYDNVSVAGPGTVTQAAGHTITTSSNVGSPYFSAPLINAGLVTSSSSGIVLNGASVRNTGTLSASNGAVLTLAAPAVVNNRGGLISAADANSSVDLAGTTVTGGTLSSANSTGSNLDSGTIHDSSPATLQNVTLAVGSVFNAENPLAIQGTLTNNGYLFMGGFNFNTRQTGGFNLAADATLAGMGTARLAGGEIDATNDATLTVAAGATLYGGSGTINARVVNNGTVSAVYQTTTINSPAFGNHGVLSASGGALLNLGATALDNTGGTISAADTTSIVDLYGTTVTGGTLSSVNSTGYNFDGGYFRDSGGATLQNVTLAAGSAFYVNNPTTIVGTLTNNGYMQVAGFNFNTEQYSSLTLSADATLAGTGTVRIAGGEIDATNNATLTVVAGATLVGGSGTINASVVNNGMLGSVYQTISINSPAFTNNGVLSAANNATVFVSSATKLSNFDPGTQTLAGGIYTATDTGDGADLDFNGRQVLVNAAAVSLSGPRASFGALSGLTANAGTLSLLNLQSFTDTASLANTGTLNLDAGSTLHVGGAFAAAPSAVLAVTVGGTQSQGAQSAGVLQVNGALNLGGNLVVTLAPGTLLVPTDLVAIGSGATVGGSFVNAVNGERVATSDGSGTFQVNYGAASAYAPGSVILSDFEATGTNFIPSFFTGQAALGSGVYYLAFRNGNPFGYYAFLADPHYIFHYDLGYEYVFDAADGQDGVYFFDFASNGFFYTSPTFPFPYLYDFSLNSVVYYYPDPNQPGHYNTNGVRYFYRFDTGTIFSK